MTLKFFCLGVIPGKVQFRNVRAIRTETTHSYVPISGVKVWKSFLLLATGILNFREYNVMSDQFYLLRKMFSSKAVTVLQGDT